MLLFNSFVDNKNHITQVISEEYLWKHRMSWERSSMIVKEGNLKNILNKIVTNFKIMFFFLIEVL